MIFKLVRFMLLQIFSRGFTVIFSIILARNLSPSEYGLYAFYFSLATVLALPVFSGSQNFIIREVARHGEKGIKTIKSNSILHILLMLIPSTLITVFLMMLGIISELSTLLLFLIFIASKGFYIRNSAILTGKELQTISFYLSEVSNSVAKLVFITILLYVDIINTDVALSVQVFGFFIGAVLTYLGLKYIGVSKHDNTQKNELNLSYSYWFKGSVPFALLSLISIANNELSTLILGYVSTEEETAFFRLGMQFNSIVSMGLIAINMYISPKIASYHSLGDFNKVQTLLNQSLLISFLYVFCCALFTFLFGGFVIDNMFGHAYSGVKDIMYIMVLAQLVNVVFGPVIMLLNMTGNEKYSFNASIISLFVLFVSLTWAVSYYSSIGAAFSNFASILFMNIYAIYQVKKRTLYLPNFRFEIFTCRG